MREYALKNGKEAVARHFHELERKPAKRIYPCHKWKKTPSIRPGDLVLFRKTTSKGTVQNVFTASRINMSNGTVLHEENGKIKGRMMKFCRPLDTGCVQAVGLRKLGKDDQKAEKSKARGKALPKQLLKAVKLCQ